MDIRALAAVGITLLFWASAFAGIRAGLTSYSPGALALLRFLVASITLAGYAVVSGVKPPSLRDLPYIGILGLLGIALYHVMLNYGELTVSAGSAGFLIATVPIFSAVLAVPFLGEGLSVRSCFGICISFVGIGLITWGEGDHGGPGLDFGALLILAAALATSLFFVLQKPYIRKYGPVQFTMYAFWAGTLFMFVFAPDLTRELRSAPAAATWSVVYLGLCPSAVSYVTWAYALSRAPVSNVASFMYLTPVLACVIAWFWLGESLSLLSLIGGIIALGGVVLVNTASHGR